LKFFDEITFGRLQMTESVPASKSVLSAFSDFKIREVDFKRPAVAATAATAQTPAPLPAPLGPLTAFTGNWIGQGFNAIFRPNNTTTPTFPPPLSTSDNVLELNLTQESLSFSPNLSSIPNRGSGTQADVFLNGVPYLQTINDVTSSPANGIHFEPGMWLNVPATKTPNEPVTVTRMASIPHGTTIVAQGVVIKTVAGAPTIDAVGMTPFPPATPAHPISPPFASQTATNSATARLPQNLAPFIAAGTITQKILDDPNTLLRNQIFHQTITETIVIGVSTNPAAPLFFGPLPGGASPTTQPPPIDPSFGGGPANIAFLQGLAVPPPTAQGPNAETTQMDAVFWIETVVYEVKVPELDAGIPSVVLSPVATNPPTLQPKFVATVPFLPGKKFAGGTVRVSATQIQYSQKVVLNFAGLSWPHVSVATLVPADPIPIPAYLLPMT
jgi:hypothetical protein